jgi:hypothetical protein
VRFNLGVQGDATALTVYVSRVPRELYTARPASDDQEENRLVVSDLRRITYWLAGDSDVPLGLARQEVKVATSDDATGPLLPEGADEVGFLIAEEVKSLQFSYWDGTAWGETWDGSALGSDGKTPIGPPLAIAIVVGIAPPSAYRGGGEPVLQYFRQVIAIPVANGAGNTTAVEP